MMKKVISLAVLSTVLSGCTAMKVEPIPVALNQIQGKLPAVDVHFEGMCHPIYENVGSQQIVQHGTSCLDLTGLMARSGMFEQVSNNGRISDIDIEVIYHSNGADNKGLALGSIILSGVTLWLIPTVYDATVYAEFIVRVNGEVRKRYHYEIETTRLQWLFASMISSGDDWSDGFSEYPVADNLVNAFLSDVRRDKQALFN